MRLRMMAFQAMVAATWCVAHYALLRGKIVLDTPEKQRSLHWLNLLMAYGAALDPQALGLAAEGP